MSQCTEEPGRRERQVFTDVSSFKDHTYFHQSGHVKSVIHQVLFARIVMLITEI